MLGGRIAFAPGLALLMVGLTLGWIARGLLGPAPAPSGDGAYKQGPSTAPPQPPTMSDPPNSLAQNPSSSPALALARAFSMMKGPGDLQVETFSPEQFSTYLERHQRSADSLLAVWQLTNDKSLLREAFERFPERIDIALAAFHNLALSDEEKTALAQSIGQVHPDSPIGPLLAAALLAKSGASAGSIGKLREALARGSLDLDVRGGRLAVREALMSLGKSPLESQLWSESKFDRAPLLSIQKLNFPVAEEIKIRLATNELDAALSLAGDGLAFAQMVGNEPSRTIMGDVIALSLEAAVLQALPPDARLEGSSQTMAERIEELKARRDSTFYVSQSLPWHLQRFDENGLALYLEVKGQRGEVEALKWAEKYHGPAPKPGP